MYGKNDIAKARVAEQGLRLHSAFYTIQGEGPFAGMPAIFLRFAGCNLRCWFCDTEFETPEEAMYGGTYQADELAALMANLAQQHSCDLFVLTGGEPMLQPLTALFNAVGDCMNSPFLVVPGSTSGPIYQTFRLQIETAGTVWPASLEECDIFDEHVVIVTSPKTKRVHAKIEQFTDAWKYIIRAGETSPDDGLPIANTHDKTKRLILYRPHPDTEKTAIFVQAMDEQGIHQARANLEAAAHVALGWGYRLSVQLHKIVGLD